MHEDCVRSRSGYVDSMQRMRQPEQSPTLWSISFRSAFAPALFICITLLGTDSAGADDSVYDLILRNGLVIDGTGNPGFHADVAVKAGKIAAIGRIADSTAQMLDVSGMVVTPGFIDVHTHAEDVDDQPLAENFIRMGVTTLVLGNCGSSPLNIGEYFQNLETITVSPNIATLVGLGTVRRRAMGGSFDR